jgi:WavE lipopolysaccharide synthesis
MRRVYTCAVVQGNLRHGTDEVLACLVAHFDRVILSTWDDENPDKIPKGDFEVVLSKKPLVPGYSHRNFQRLSTAAGLRRAEELGASHVLKWRTDMLPTKLNVQQLLKWANHEVPPGFDSRLVTCAFRNLTVKQDWFSTIPDLFAFADIQLMKLLWNDESFDYSQVMNVPEDMTSEYGLGWQKESDSAGLYCAEAEHYAIFKSRLQKKICNQLTHLEIAKKYMRLINHRSLGICWLGQDGNFRSISQALQHPWWTEWTWKYGSPHCVEAGYIETTWLQKIRRKHLTRRVIKYEIYQQRKWHESYLRLS